MAIDPKEVGRRIAAARKRKGWTQLQFALEADVSPSAVAKWEAGKLPPVRELVRLAEPELLNVDVCDLVDPAGQDAGSISDRLSRLEAGAGETRELLRDVAAHLGIPVRGLPPEGEAPAI